MFTYIELIFTVSVGKYTNPIDPMGMEGYNLILFSSLTQITSFCSQLTWLSNLNHHECFV